MGADGRAHHSSQFQVLKDNTNDGLINLTEFDFKKLDKLKSNPSVKSRKVEHLPERVGIVPPRGINKKNRRKRVRMAARAMQSIRLNNELARKRLVKS